MGTLATHAPRTAAESNRFYKQLLRDLSALDLMLREGLFEADVTRIGIEQELFLVDNFWCPTPLSEMVLQEIGDADFTTELARYNLEVNLAPQLLASDCFSRIEALLGEKLSRLRALLQKVDARYVLTGILPTIRSIDLSMESLSPYDRYRDLFESLRNLRGGDFEFQIRGNDELIFKQDYPTMEFCNASFQIHLQLNPAQFVDGYNISKLITAPVLAACTNSPLLLGRRLWRESRIAVFQQAIDTRVMTNYLRERVGRVYLSREWLSQSIMEIFKNDISRFRNLLVADIDEDPIEVLKSGNIPRLAALQLFNGTVYRWNRACYGITNGKPHLRIENRVIPSGPTIVDEVANAAFWVGLMTAMPEAYRNASASLSAHSIVNNFNLAARHGLDAYLEWMPQRKVNARELILEELLPIAEQGLKDRLIKPEDIKKYIGIIRERVVLRKTGADWLLDNFERLRAKHGTEEVLVGLTAGLAMREAEGRPVHQWEDAKMRDSGVWWNKMYWVGQIMSTDLFTVRRDDPVELILNVMQWRQIHHIPVEEAQGEVVGMIDSDSILRHHISCRALDHCECTAADIMLENPVSVPPEMLTVDALALMQQNKIRCLPVIKGDKLIGIVTEHDFLRISQRLFKDITRQDAKT